MKVQGLNSSSKKTRELIKKNFAELINEKKELSKVTVTELVKRAGITRSTFYTHYEDIYDVVNDYQLETIELLVSDDISLTSTEDIYKYFDKIFDSLNKNEEIYKMLLAANGSIIFLENLKKLAGKKIYYAMQNLTSNKYLELDVDFFMNGVITELIKYFRNQSDYTSEEILLNSKKWFKKLFN